MDSQRRLEKAKKNSDALAQSRSTGPGGEAYWRAWVTRTPDPRLTNEKRCFDQISLAEPSLSVRNGSGKVGSVQIDYTRA